jgi:hypothetical protein
MSDSTRPLFSVVVPACQGGFELPLSHAPVNEQGGRPWACRSVFLEIAYVLGHLRKWQVRYAVEFPSLREANS